MGFEALGGHAAGPFVNRELAERLEPSPDLRFEDLVAGPRLRIDHDQGSGHHLLSGFLRQRAAKSKRYHGAARFAKAKLAK
jgi:hypothetical protein